MSPLPLPSPGDPRDERELAGDATLFAVGITTQGMQATEARADRCLLLGVLDGDLAAEKVLAGHVHSLQQLEKEKTLQVIIYFSEHKIN